MSKRRLVISAVLAGQSQSEVARTYGVSQGWISRLMARYRVDGEAAFEPRSRAPKTSPAATAADVAESVLRLRKQLDDAGLDAGADTIGWHLARHHGTTLSRATINRILLRAGAVTPDPSKRPKSSYIRFEAEMPNECWQSDFTHYRLIDSTDTEILTRLDDHSRYALSVTAHRRVTGPIVLATFPKTVATHGIPASTLTDNRMVFTTRYAGGRGGRNHLEHELRDLHVRRSRTAIPTIRRPRQGRTVPADAEEMATRPTRSAGHHRRAANTARRVHRNLQPAPTAPVTAAPSNARNRLHD